MEELPDALDVTNAVSPAAEIEENKSLKSPLNAKHETTNVRMEEPSRSIQFNRFLAEGEAY